MRLLLLEDDLAQARALLQGLREEVYVVDWARCLAEVLPLLSENEYDLLILDVRVPDGSGFNLLRELRLERCNTPALFLTARDRLEDRIDGLDAGGDDYLTKPFSFDELLARIRSLLRRRSDQGAVSHLAFDGLELDYSRRMLSCCGRSVHLTPKEVDVLECLLTAPGRILTRERLARRVWENAGASRSNIVDVVVGRVRRHLESLGWSGHLQTVKGVGHRLVRAGEDAAL